MKLTISLRSLGYKLDPLLVISDGRFGVKVFSDLLSEKESPDIEARYSEVIKYNIRVKDI